MSDYYLLTTHSHLTILLEDSCIEISIQRFAHVILLRCEIHIVMQIMISISHYIIIPYDKTLQNRTIEQR